MRSFVDINFFSREEIRKILNLAYSIKKNPEKYENTLYRKILGLFFSKQSTRTRTSFEVGMRKLGGAVVFYNASDSQVSRGESVEDTAKVFGLYLDALAVRCVDHRDLLSFRDHAGIPIINALTNFSHPCQALADVMTYEEKKGSIEDANIVWFGDNNNILRSWFHVAEVMGSNLTVSGPRSIFEGSGILESSPFKHKQIVYEPDPLKAVKDATLITTDTWFSMDDSGLDEKARVDKIRDCMQYQVNDILMNANQKEAIFLHCMPAFRGMEVTAEVLESNRSCIYEEALNRMYAQQAVLIHCLLPGKWDSLI